MTRPVVVVELRGRLGNQLFEWAAGEAVARRHDADLRFLRYPSLNPADVLLPRVVGSRYQPASARELLRVFRVRPEAPLAADANRVLGAVRRVATTRSRPRVATIRPPAGYASAILDIEPPVLLRGFFQDERYFDHIRADILAALQLRTNALDDMARPVVGVSFRRGDFHTFDALLPLDYYDRALATVTERTTIGSIAIFCDDPDFAELAVPWLSRTAPAVSCSIDDPVEQLAQLAACDHLVIPNSTFAWWGAWVANQRRPEMIVVAPRGKGEESTRAPSRWITLEPGRSTRW